jgi:hypothetical protein
MNRKNNFVILFTTVLFFYFTLRPLTAAAQTSASGESHNSILYKTIVHMDSVVFDAFNSNNLIVLASVFAKDVEFYHDKGGLSDYTSTMDGFKKLAEVNPGLKRELVPGTLEVYPVPGYGAIEIGEHRFTHIENGKEVIGVFKFTLIWQYKDGEWKITRVVSVGH